MSDDLLDDAQLEAARPADYLGYASLLRARVGAESSAIHLGRSRQDILLVLARRQPRAVVPTYTNGVQAQPTSLAHLMLGYESALRRCSTTLEDTYAALDRSPLGAAQPVEVDRMLAEAQDALEADHDTARQRLDAVSAAEHALAERLRDL